MKKITQLFTFNLYSDNAKLVKMLSSVVVSVDRIKTDDLQENINNIQRRFNYAMKNKVINDVLSDWVIPVYNKERLAQIPIFFPAFLIKNNGQPTAIVNFTSRALKTQAGWQIDNRTLFSLLQTGTILRDCFFNWNKITMSSIILKQGSAAFAKLFFKIVDKACTVSLNKRLVDTVLYLASKYFLMSIMERADNDSVKGICLANTINGTTESYLMGVAETVPPEAFTDINTFVTELSKLEGLSKLNTRNVLDNWMRMYGTATIGGIEYFPYFCDMLFSSMIGAHTANEMMIDTAVKKETVELYNEIARIIR